MGHGGMVSRKRFADLRQQLCSIVSMCLSPEGNEIREQLFTISQGSRGVAEYALEFHTLATGSR